MAIKQAAPRRSKADTRRPHKQGQHNHRRLDIIEKCMQNVVEVTEEWEKEEAMNCIQDTAGGWWQW